MPSASHHRGDDPALTAAAARARQTFGYFWREVSWEQRRIVPGLGMSAVKVAFADGDVVEHLWVDVHGFDGTTVTGAVINEPFDLTTVHAGDEVAIPLERLEDWMFTIDDVAHGGFSIHVLRAAMGRRERKQHDQAWGLRFPDPPLVVHGQERHPERLVDHPMCVNTRSQFAALLQTERHHATDVDDEGFTMLQREAIAGNAPLVTLLLAFGADPTASGPHGLTATAYAERLGWTPVLEALRG